MEVGEKCICKVDKLYNAFGETCNILKQGMRLTVRTKERFNGLYFYGFEEAPEDCTYMYDCFTPIRNLN